MLKGLTTNVMLMKIGVMWLCVERESYLGFGKRVGMRTTGRNIVRQKNTKRKAHIGMNQKAREAVVSCFELPKGWGGKDGVGVSCLKGESGGGRRGKVWMIERKSGQSTWKLSEKFRAKNKTLIFKLVDLEMAFDRVPTKLCPSRVCFESTFIHHGNGCSDRRCEGWYINGVVVCGRSCFVWRIIK